MSSILPHLNCYGVLVALRKIKNFTNYHLRKHLVECLVLSRLDFNDIIFYPITDCLLKGYSASSLQQPVLFLDAVWKISTLFLS